MKNYFQSVVIILMMATSISLNAQNSSASIKGEEITYSDGATVLKGYVAYNENQKGKRPAIIVVPEWWGCSEYVRMRARKLAEHWLNFLIHNPSLCRDNPSLIPNDSNFKENRHDQSVFSLLVKVLQRRSLLSVSSLNDNQIRSDNLLPHRKKHPVRKLIES